MQFKPTSIASIRRWQQTNLYNFLTSVVSIVFLQSQRPSPHILGPSHRGFRAQVVGGNFKEGRVGDEKSRQSFQGPSHGREGLLAATVGTSPDPSSSLKA